MDPSVKQHLKQVPFWLYLSCVMRTTLDHFMRFQSSAIAMLMVTYALFIPTHMILHIAYVRIMIGVASIVVVLVSGMMYVIYSQRKRIDTYEPGKSPRLQSRAGSVDLDSLAYLERAVVNVLQWCIFLMAFAAARVCVSPPMWNLYGVTLMSTVILSVGLAVALLAYVLKSVLVSFSTTVGLPPFISRDNMDVIASVVAEYAKDFENHQSIDFGAMQNFKAAKKMADV
jgi:hypothetical protein